MFRSRLTSLLLLLASPAMGGTILPLAHPCPVDAPWLAPSGSDPVHLREDGPNPADEHAGHHPSGAPDGQTTSHSCTCPGACTVGLGLSVPSATGTSAFAGVPVQVFQPFIEHAAPWTPSVLDRLPPSTAPPIA